ncbi:hypothetical protein D3C74_92340 [compost metagenome]
MVLNHNVEAASPWEQAVLVRKCARRAVLVEECEAHGLTCGLLDSARTLKVVEVRGTEARAYCVDFDVCGLEFDGKSERDRIQGGLGRAVNGTEHRAVRIGRVRVQR